MKIEILGTGCHNCIRLESLVGEILLELGKTNAEVVRISDELTIQRHIGLDEIPGLLIDGVLASTRELPSKEMLKEWLSKVK